eukprot:CAMPEP_0197080682 /NCGR_PEP_ID=MMETSP1384-20130603/214253_1 /TAXON_ID=29189 /ORGANISM="Ammonia sp." /LENGTH=476 /DNA_ID=CAMNT_0042519573 /DNA_START=127 /DNA_END=1554 /DNA_ORIENTATION=-
MTTAELIATDSRLTVEDIDDILDEIEERESKTLLLNKFDHRLALKPTQSLEIELGMAGDQQIPTFHHTDFDPHCLINGYFIVYLLQSMQSTPERILTRIVDLCLLYTFNEEDEAPGSHGQLAEHDMVMLDPTSPSPFSPSVGIQGIDDNDNAKSNDNMHDRYGHRMRSSEEDEETSASELDEEDMCAIMVPFGHAQSPINIITKPSSPFAPQMMDNTELFVANPLRFNYPPLVSNCSVINNGHTVQMNMPDTKKQCSLFVRNKLYKLRHVHFHTPSEHTIDGKQYEMEMHLIHINEEHEMAVLAFIFSTKQLYKKPALQLSKSRQHLVLQKEPKTMAGNKKKGQLYVSSVKEAEEVSGDESEDMETDDEEESDECKQQQQQRGNDFLQQFWNELPVNRTEKEMRLNKPISFDYLFETSSNNFSKNVETNQMNIDMEIFEYMGSLTIPPYTEGVQWLVSKSLHYINEQQLEKLRSCW